MAFAVFDIETFMSVTDIALQFDLVEPSRRGGRLCSGLWGVIVDSATVSRSSGLTFVKRLYLSSQRADDFGLPYSIPA